MPPGKEQLDRLFQQFLEGKATPEEHAFLLKWLWMLDVQEQQLFLERRQEAELRERMRARILLQVQPPKPIERRSFRRYWVAAACCILLAGAVYLSFFLNGNREKQGAPAQTAAYTTITNHSQEPKYVLLPDSSELFLGAASSIIYASTYNTRDRRIELKGEGYFNVHKDPQRPFVVASGMLETEALGTAFNVEYYESESKISITLRSGKVAVTGADEKNKAENHILEPGQMLQYNKSSREVKLLPVNAEDLAWLKGGFDFHRTPLADALERIAVRYGLQIRYDKHKLENKTITGTFGKSTWDKILLNVLFIHNMQYRESDKVIYVE